LKGFFLGNTSKGGADIFTTIKRGRVSDEIVKQIKELIFNGGLTVGDQLPSERDLAKKLGVSRVPVREALFSLERSPGSLNLFHCTVL